MVKKKSDKIEEPEKVSEEVAVEEPVEEKLPQFKNNTGKGIKIKLVDGKKFEWLTVKEGDTVTIPRKLALKNKLVEVE